MGEDIQRELEDKSVEIPTRYVLALCEYPVPAGHGTDEGCEEPAIAVWKWPDGGGKMFVCAEHDAEIMKQEEEEVKKEDDEYGDYKDWGNIKTYIKQKGE